MKELKYIVKLGHNYYLCQTKEGIKYSSIDMATPYESKDKAVYAGMTLPFENFSIEERYYCKD